MKHKKIELYTDGGARGNPGPAGIGGVLYADGKKVGEFKKFIGETTNNQAEYQALVRGLHEAEELGAEEVSCFLDSELIVKQLNKEYKVKDQYLASLFVKVWNASQKFKSVTFEHIRREKNIEADSLVNQAIDKATKK